MAVAFAIALAAIPIAYAAQSANGATEMRFACTKKSGGELRYVKRAGACANNERLIRFHRDEPVIVCARQGGNVYVVNSRRACRRAPHAPSLVFVLPNSKERHTFCANKRTGTLRSIEHVPYDPPRPPRSDGGACKSSEKRVFVKRADRPPNARDDAATTDEASAAPIDVLANDRDPEGRRLRIQSIDATGLRGAVAVSADRRSLTYNPSGQFEALGVGASATEAFTYRATDGSKRDRARVTVTVRGLNDAPNAVADAASTDESTATTLAVLSNDSDPDQGDSLAVSAVDTTGTAGAVTINPDGTVRYDPAGRLDDLAPGESRIDRFAYTMSDGHGGTASATASVNVSGVNDAPTIALSDANVAENLPSGTLVGELSGTDPELDSLSFSFAAGAGDADNGQFQINGTQLQTGAVFDRETKASYSIRLRVADGTGGTSEEQFTIAVTDVNEAPTDISLSPASVEEGLAVGSMVGTFAATDQDQPGDALAFSLVAGAGDADNGSFMISGAELRTTEVFDFETKSSYSIRVRVLDGNGGTFEEQLAVTVTDGNEAPTDIALSPSTVAENEPINTVVGTLSGSDPDPGDAFTFSLVAGAGDDDNGSFNISGGSLRTSASLDFEVDSTRLIRVRVTDSGGLSFEKQFTVTVANANDAPTDIALGNSSVAENQASGSLVGLLSGSDQDALDVLSFSFASGAGDTDNGQFQISGTQLQSNAVFDFETKSIYSIRLRVSDGSGGSFEEQFTIEVTDANDAPTNITLTPSSVDEGRPVGTTVGTIAATDEDLPADTFTFSFASGAGDADNGSFTISGNTLQTDEVFNFNVKNSYTIRVAVSDGEGGTFEKQLTVTINNINQAPTDISLSPSTVAENQPANTVVGALTATDPDAGDPFTFTLVSGTGDTDNGSFNIAGSSLRTSGTFDFEMKSSYSIRVAVFDGADTFAKQLTVTVTNANDAPTDIDLGNASVQENQPSGTLVGLLTGIDQDTLDVLSFSFASGAGDADNAQFQISGTQLQTGAAFDFENKSSYSIRLRVSDGNGGTFEEQFTITITDVNDAPTDIGLSPSSVNEGLPVGTTVGTLSAVDQDQPPDTFAFSLVAGAGDADNASFTISGNTLQTNAVFDFETKNSFAIRVRVSDGEGGTLEEQFTVTVSNVNEAPTNVALAQSTVAENQPVNTVVGALSATDQDTGDTFTFSLVAGEGDTDNGSFNIAGGSLRTSQVFDFEIKSSYSIRVRATDGGGLSFEKQLTVTVTNANDAPTDLALDDASVQENEPAGTAVGTLSSTDQDAGATHTYSLVSGAGDTNNAQFQISGTSLQTSQSLNFEAGATRSVRVRTTDDGGAMFEKQLTITVTDANDAPVADDESFSGTFAAVGNTAHVGNDSSDAAPDPAGAQKTISADILDGDTDEDGNGSLAVVAGTVATNDGGSVVLEADGDFTFHPSAGTSCTDTSDFFDYTVTDQNTTKPPLPATAKTDVGRVTISIAGCVWHVNNNHTGVPDDLGTSQAPFNTLAQAETASGANHTVFVFDGDNTPTGLGGDGYAMNAGERLIGEHEGLQVGADALHPANPGAHPTLTATSADVIDLDDGNEIRGINVDPQNAGGIAGTAGDTGGGTIDDVNVVDTFGINATQAGLELSGTTGTFNITNLSVNTNAAGVLLTNAGTTDFGTTTIASNGLPGLSASGTNMGTSTFDAITVTGSTNGGVSMTNTTGTTVFGDGTGVDLALTTSSGTAPAFALSSAGTITVPAGGTANLNATGGPAVDVTGTSGAALPFDAVSSTNSANDGINLAGLGTGTFSAASGTITGASGIAVDLDGGSGDVTYPGTISNGPGSTAEISGRTGGTATLSGAITETGDADATQENGGIAVSGNTGGSTVLNNATKTFNTGEDDAIVMGTSDGHTLNLTGGSLDIDTTSGQGIVANNSGTIVVSGTGNSVLSTTGRAVNVQNTDFGAVGFTFQSVSANGAINGINLSGTGSAAGITVTGVGSTTQGGDNSGGTIQSTTGPGISLTNTVSPSFRNLRLLNTGDSAINGTQVTGFSFTDGTITGAGDASDENSITFDDSLTSTPNLTGAVTITNNVISQTEAEGVDIENWAGTISDANISNNALSDTGDVATPGSAITLIGSGLASSAANITRATVANNTITDFRAGVGVQVRAGNPNAGAPTGSAGTAGNATNVIAVTGNSMNGGNAGVGNQPDRFFTGGVSGNGGQGNFNVSNNGTAANRLRNIDCIAIEMQMDGPVTMTSTVQNNFINANSAVGCAGIAVGTDDPNNLGAGTHSTLISGNNVMGTNGPGIFPIVRDSGSTMTARVLNNTVAAPNATNAARAGIRVDSGSAAGDTTMCLEISGNTTAGSTNNDTLTTSPGINLRKQGTSTTVNTFGIEGMSATASPGVENYVNGLNTSTSGTFGVGGTALLSATSGFTNCNAP